MTAQTNGPSEQRPAWWTKGRIVAVTAGGVAATLIGVLAIVVPLVAAGGEQQTTPESVVAEGTDPETASEVEEPERLLPAVSSGLMAAAGDVSSASQLLESDWYAVPVDAPWEELFALPPACVSLDAAEWVVAHGEPILPYEINTVLTNVATSGSAAVISDIRAEGELTVPPVETVVVGVMGCKGAGDEGVYATMTLGVDPVAVWHDCYGQGFCTGSSEEVPVPGDPVVFSLSPGEKTSLHLTWDQTLDFVGRFVATVTVDGAASTIDLSPDGVDLVVPWVTYPERRLYIDSDASFNWCEAAPGSRVEGCTAEAWRQIVAAG